MERMRSSGGPGGVTAHVLELRALEKTREAGA